MWEVVGDQQADMTFDSDTIHPYNDSSYKANTGQCFRTDNANVVYDNSNNLGISSLASTEQVTKEPVR